MKRNMIGLSATLAASVAAASLSACTQQTPNSFRLRQQRENFAVIQEFNTKVDLLWVVDNSSSMNVSQDKIRRGFEAFARKYLMATWDIRLAVLTTDAYMGNPAFKSYLKTAIDGKSGITWNDQVPAWGMDYAKLIPGIHDGPIAGLCTEKNPYFFYGKSQCQIRDDQTRYSGVEHCINPALGESAVTQCVNTAKNDTVHSGKAILSTRDSIDTLVRDFTVNVSVGTAGSGSERGLSSVIQLLTDNEKSPSAFFRPGSQRVIVFVTDEDDQSMAIPSKPTQGFTPNTGILSSCQPKTVDGYTYTLSTCADPSKLIPVSEIKESLDSFFAALDAKTAKPSNYFVVPIVPLTGAALQQMQALRAPDDEAAGNPGNVAVDRGDRYLELAQLVSNGSFALNIAEDDYGSLLDQIGRAIIQRKNSFELKRAPTGQEDMIVVIAHADGTETVVRPDQYTINGNTLEMTDINFVLSLTSSDQILVNYQPATVL